MGVKVGLDCKLYRNTGTFGSPTWVEITTAKDVTLNLDKADADASSRVSRWKKSWFAHKEASLEFEILRDPAKAEYAALESAYLNDTTLDIAVSDGAIATSGNEYFRSDEGVFKFSRNEPLDNVVTNTVGLKHVYSSNDPSFTTVP